MRQSRRTTALLIEALNRMEVGRSAETVARRSGVSEQLFYALQAHGRPNVSDEREVGAQGKRSRHDDAQLSGW